MLRGDLSQLPVGVRDFVEHSDHLCQPEGIHICEGTEVKNTATFGLLEEQGPFQKFPKYKYCSLAHTDPKDVAQVENRLVIVILLQ